VPNSHPIAANAKPESQKEPQFIIGRPQVKCSVQIVGKHSFGSFSPVWLMKKSTQAVEILSLVKIG